MLTSAVLLMLAAPVGLAPPQGPDDTAGWTVRQLREEHARIDELRPGAALPVATLVSGLIGAVTSLIAYAIALGNWRGASSLANAAFGLGGSTSLALIGYGGFRLIWESPQRATYSAQLEKLKRLADVQEREERFFDIWNRRYGNGISPQVPHPPPVGPPVPQKAPPIEPSAPIVPGEVSLVVPLIFARF